MSKFQPETLLKTAMASAAKAHAPYSRIRIGAALLAEDGTVFAGCNIENASYGLTLCAERTAMFTAVAEGHRHFQALAVVSDSHQMPYPCGACRQVLFEFCDLEFNIYVASIRQLELVEEVSLGYLLPKGFRL